MRDKVPQVLISYSWTTEEFKQKVKHLARDLMHDGIDVKLDIWELKDGQDKYAFMEQNQQAMSYSEFIPLFWRIKSSQRYRTI